MSTDIWDGWNEHGNPKYPNEKVIQFCFRNYPPASRKSTRALDLGCGSGANTVFLASEGFCVTGTDISTVGISNTRQRLQALGLEAALRVESADILDFPPNSFDLVICVRVYDCSGPVVAKASVERLREVLSPGGRGFFLFASDRDYRIEGEGALNLHGYTRDEVEEIFAPGSSQVWLDRYITTYQSGQIEQNEWLVTLET